MLKTYKYKLLPTRKQVAQLQWTLEQCRALYNAALQERRDAWNVCKRHPNFYDPVWRKDHARNYRVTYLTQAEQLSDLKAELPAYQEVHSQVLQDSLKRVEKAFQAFFRRVQRGEKPGYPRFQGRDRYDSFTYVRHEVAPLEWYAAYTAHPG